MITQQCQHNDPRTYTEGRNERGDQVMRCPVCKRFMGYPPRYTPKSSTRGQKRYGSETPQDDYE